MGQTIEAKTLSMNEQLTKPQSFFLRMTNGDDAQRKLFLPA
jgi:hypothetical protein